MPYTPQRLYSQSYNTKLHGKYLQEEHNEQQSYIAGQIIITYRASQEYEHHCRFAVLWCG